MYQGIDSMPDLVQSCYRNLVYHYGKRVRLVTSDNLADYIQIPDFVVNKVKSGNISLTHFSDIVRCSLLAQYGGLWLDSTCWVTDKIPDYITQLNIYSSKDPTIQNLPLWSNGRWTGWLMGTNMKNYPLFCFCRDLLFAYWNKEDKLIDYLLIDFCLLMGYETLESIKSQMDKIPPNNAERNTLYYLLDQEYDEERFQQICKNSWCFKLSYKHHHRIYSKDGKITFYGKLIGKSEIDA